MHKQTDPIICRGLEAHATAFRYLIEFGLGSESHIVRGMMTRLCVRAAGMGGGMGLFLVEPVISEMTSLIMNSGKASASDYYRIAEALSAMVPWPALKAAFLDVKLTSSISRLLHGVAPDCQKDPSLLAISSAFLDVFVILLDPEVCMDPFESNETRLRTDCPSASELGVMVAALFANLHHFPSLQEKVLKLLQGTVAMPDGTSILIRGISRWQTAHMSQGSPTESSTEALVDWAIAKLESSAGTAKQIHLVVQYLKDQSLNVDQMMEGITTERVPAPERFKTIVHKSQETAQKTWKTQDKTDPALNLFWRFVHAFPPYQLKKTWTKWSCTKTESMAAYHYFTGQSFLSASCRSREVLINPSIYRMAHDQSDAGSVGPISEMKVHSELPPVVAPPRRGQENRRVNPSSIGSRPPSVHVDEYHRSVEEEGSQPRTSSDQEASIKQTLTVCTDR